MVKDIFNDKNYYFLNSYFKLILDNNNKGETFSNIILENRRKIDEQNLNYKITKFIINHQRDTNKYDDSHEIFNLIKDFINSYSMIKITILDEKFLNNKFYDSQYVNSLNIIEDSNVSMDERIKLHKIIKGNNNKFITSKEIKQNNIIVSYINRYTLKNVEKLENKFIPEIENIIKQKYPIYTMYDVLNMYFYPTFERIKLGKNVSPFSVFEHYIFKIRLINY